MGEEVKVIIAFLIVSTAFASAKKPHEQNQIPTTLPTNTNVKIGTDLPKSTEACSLNEFEREFFDAFKKRGINLLENDGVTVLLVSDEFTKNWSCAWEPTAIACQNGKAIQLKKSYYDSVSCGTRKELYFHERGHSIGLPHSSPNSTMQPALMGGYYWLPEQEKYDTQMVNQFKKLRGIK